MKYNKFNVHIEGINGKLSDIDYLDAVLKSISQNNFAKDLSSPPYFKQNKILQNFLNIFSPSLKKGQQ